MTLDHWLAFVVAASILLTIPGPTALLVISHALGHGRRAIASTVTGVVLGDFTAMTASIVGLGALLAASAALFAILKWIGAAYLVFLGVKLWRAPVSGDAGAVAPVESRRLLLHAYAVTALNPKSIVFFVAFLPQFLDPGRPVLPQFAIFEATFLTLAACNALAYAKLASAARRAIRKPRIQRAVNRVGGSLLIGAGALTATWKRAAG